MAFWDKWFNKSGGKKRGDIDYKGAESEIYENPLTMGTDVHQGGGESGSTRAGTPPPHATGGVVIPSDLRKEFDSSLGFFSFNFTTKSKAKRLMKWDLEVQAKLGSTNPKDIE